MAYCSLIGQSIKVRSKDVLTGTKIIVEKILAGQAVVLGGSIDLGAVTC
jgi:hypothetical protein